MPEVDNRDPVQHGAGKSRHRPFDEITEHTRRREYDKTLLGDADKTEACAQNSASASPVS